MQTEKQTERRNKKRIIGRSIVVFLTVILLLTFFSNTINNFTAPKVSIENPGGGQIVKEITATGTVKAKKTVEHYTMTEMKVRNVGVKVGDAVKKGQFILSLDIEDIEKQVKNETSIYQQKKLNVEKLSQETSEEALFSYDKAVETARINVEKARRDFENKRLLYEAGGESRVNVEDAERDLKNAEMEYEAAENNRTKAADNSRRDLESAQAELDIQERRLADLKKQLEFKSIAAPVDGIITELNFQEGMVANNSKPLYKLADTEKGFQFTASVNEDAAAYLMPGDIAYVTVDSLDGSAIEAEITEIAESREQRGIKKELLMNISADGLIGGESGSVDIKKPTKTYDVLVSNSAIGQDMTGYFVYVVSESKGPLGNEFHVQKVQISIGEADYQKTGVTSGISPYDKVVVNSDKPVADGTRVIVSQ